MFINEKFRYWLPVGLYAVLIFSLSATPAKYVPQVLPGVDKVVHFLEYLPFGTLVWRAVLKTGRFSPLNSLLSAIFVVVLYSLSDEFHQFFVPGRQFDLIDAFFDILGATVGGMIYGKNRTF